MQDPAVEEVFELVGGIDPAQRGEGEGLAVGPGHLDLHVLARLQSRSNLVGMGVLPLQFMGGDTRDSLGLTGDDAFTIHGVAGLKPRQDVKVEVTRPDGETFNFTALCRIDTANELEYFLNGGILHYVLRKLAA